MKCHLHEQRSKISGAMNSLPSILNGILPSAHIYQFVTMNETIIDEFSNYVNGE
jgi:hypothetical protein